MADFVLGKDCKLYAGAKDAALASQSEVTIAREVTVNLSASLADVTTRGSAGWRAQAAGLRELSLDFGMVFKPGDTQGELIRDAFLAGTEISMSALTGGATTAGSEGPRGNFTISGFTRGEALEDGVTVDVTATLTKYEEWVEVAGSGS
jgi:predicted secreted protein